MNRVHETSDKRRGDAKSIPFQACQGPIRFRYICLRTTSAIRPLPDSKSLPKRPRGWLAGREGGREEGERGLVKKDLAGLKTIFPS